jgi:cell fate regulator YaaT (PSP1 superfamily)
MGQVNSPPRSLWFKDDSQPPRVIRQVNSEKDRAPADLKRIEEDMRRVCADLAVQKKLVFKVVDAEYLYWENRVIFYFVSEGRVDFRELVKDLSRDVRCRVEMRQIGPRDETRLLGGIGTCGREHCCTSHLTQFDSIRIKMVKDQGLVLNPQKVSGGCGKLKCCLAYEVEVYKRLKAEMPAIGSMVKVPDGRVGRVYEVDVMGRKVGLIFTDGETTQRGTFPVAQLKDDTGRSLAREEDLVRDDGIGKEYLINTGKRQLEAMPLTDEPQGEPGPDGEFLTDDPSPTGLRRRRPGELARAGRVGGPSGEANGAPRGRGGEGRPAEGGGRPQGDGQRDRSGGRSRRPRREGGQRDGSKDPGAQGGQREGGGSQGGQRDGGGGQGGQREGGGGQGPRSPRNSDQKPRQGQRRPRQEGQKPEGARPEGARPEGNRPEGNRRNNDRRDRAKPKGNEGDAPKES